MEEGWSTARPVPRSKPGVAHLEIDGESVLYDPERWAVLRLDRVGTLVWSVLDGEGFVGDLAEDLADAFSVPQDEALSGLLALLDRLTQTGFLDDGSPVGPELPDDPPPLRHLVDPPSP